MSHTQDDIDSGPPVSAHATPPTNLPGSAKRRETPFDDDVDADFSEAATERDTDADSSETSGTDGS